MPEFVSKGGRWVQKESVVPSTPKEPVIKEPEKVEKVEKVEEKPVTKSKPKKKGR